MKLRIIHVDSDTRLAGTFIVQRRSWGFWKDMYFDKDSENLVLDSLLGSAKIIKAEFVDLAYATSLAEKFKSYGGKRRIRQLWKI